jgi:acyl-CoA synthetase (AMP-forming)/AMP-acid ligase II
MAKPDKRYEATLIHQFLEWSAARNPHQVAVVHQDKTITYRELNQRATKFAYWLIDAGIAVGDRVPFIMENGIDYVTVYYGILKAGAVAVPLSTDLKPTTLKPLLEELAPSAVVATSRFERLLKATDYPWPVLVIGNPKLAWQNTSARITALEDIVYPSADIDGPDLDVESDHLASIIYTSGSTGKPKGVMLSHRNIVDNANAICDYLDLTANDVQMVVLPFFYVMGKSLLNTHVAVGGRLVINNKFAYPATVVQEMVTAEVTGFSGVPSTYAYLLHRSPLAKYRDRLTTLRYCSQAGGHMSAHIKQELLRILPSHTKLFIMYGATEAAARLTYLPPEYLQAKIESIGIAIPGVTMKVLDKQGNPLPPGQVGEIVGAGSNIMAGYWKNPEETAKALDEHGYHTGDVGYYDEDGFLFLEGRKDNIVKVGGHRISLQEIEDAMMATDLLVETAVLGLADELLGNKLSAIAVAKEDGDQRQALMQQVADRLPKYKHPQELHFVRSLPKNSSGKVDRQACLDLMRKLSGA